ncbi:MAG TPA: saccharopine dehydrogenase [Gammaproteobacteria bacterium]|nr:saccharopine dehydrogenase [Gammaproteobacteria bacterium]|tara:strand:- start:5067 stop:6290 length:1224 start_codon:yes stop_codon:yes gene_type:complete
MESASLERQYDIIVWGATGFTGRLVTEYMATRYLDSNVRWAIAGRNSSKLESLVAGRNIPMLTADSHDPASLAALVKQTKVILTTVGPYARYGSELVAACSEQGTHYCDLTGEVHWMRKMIDEHQTTAAASGAVIVHTCGFDSIPSDMGVYFLQKQMQEKHGVTAQQIKYRTRAFKGGFSGGTADSMIAMMEAAQKDPSIRRIAGNPYSLNDGPPGRDGGDRFGVYFDEDFGAWVGPFVMAGVNTRVVRRSNELLSARSAGYGENFRYDEGSVVGEGAKGFLGATAMSVGTGAFVGLAAIPLTRKGLQKFLPKPGEGPTVEQIENGFFTVELLGKHPSDSSKDIRVRVHGDRDPGYGSTSKMIAESAIALAQEELPVGGGIWTPASAIGDALLARLPANAGVTFEVI